MENKEEEANWEKGNEGGQKGEEKWLWKCDKCDM